MRQIITQSSQIKDITGSWSYDTPAAFPISLTNASPREVAKLYLGLDYGRRIKIDPVEMTIEFEPPPEKSIVSKVVVGLRV